MPDEPTVWYTVLNSFTQKTDPNTLNRVLEIPTKTLISNHKHFMLQDKIIHVKYTHIKV